MKEIYFAGGCFWGTEHYFRQIRGVRSTVVGYANGNTNSPSYEDVCHRNSGHAEAVRVNYDEQTITLDFLLGMYFEVVDPTSLDRQGGDRGRQYRTGIYYTDSADAVVISRAIANLQKAHTQKIAIEVKKLDNFFDAEIYHQGYLQKNPNGYCHIGKAQFDRAKVAVDKTAKSNM